MYHSFALWRWNAQSVGIVDGKWLKDTLNSVELKLPTIWSSEMAQENFLDTPDVLKQMESLIAGRAENENWMEPIPVELP
jgi:hypothetical protein